MTPQPDTAPPDVTVADFIDRYLLLRHHSTFPLVEGDQLVGPVTFRRVALRPVERRGSTTSRRRR